MNELAETPPLTEIVQSGAERMACPFCDSKWRVYSHSTVEVHPLYWARTHDASCRKPFRD